MTDRLPDEPTQALLRAAGWFPGRAVDTSSFVACWESREIPTVTPAVEFCREFGGLKITHPPVVRVGEVEHSDFTNLDPVWATDGISDRMIAEYSRLAAEPLCPVGSNRSHMTIMIGPSGRVLAGVDNYLFQYGDDSAEALEKMCAGRRPEKIGEWFP
jgi:SUKH-3 immunity protein